MSSIFMSDIIRASVQHDHETAGAPQAGGAAGDRERRDGAVRGRGFDEAMISQVADAAGVSKMTVTNYFRARRTGLRLGRGASAAWLMPPPRARRARACWRRSAVTTPSGSPRATSPSACPRDVRRMVHDSHVLARRGREIEDCASRRSATLSPPAARTTRSSGSWPPNSRRYTGSCSRKAPGASWPGSCATRSTRRSRRPPSGLRPTRAVPGRLRHQGRSQT